MGGQEVTDSGQRKRQKDVPEGEVGTQEVRGSPIWPQPTMEQLLRFN